MSSEVTFRIQNDASSTTNVFEPEIRNNTEQLTDRDEEAGEETLSVDSKALPTNSKETEEVSDDENSRSKSFDLQPNHNEDAPVEDVPVEDVPGNVGCFT